MRIGRRNPLFRLLVRTGIPRLLHRRLLRNRLTILMYHGVVRTPLRLDHSCFVGETRFRSQLSYLKRHFQVLPPAEAIDRMRRGRIEEPTAAVTFDDGLYNNYEIAFPILRELKIPATVFVATRFIDSNDTPWSYRLHHALERTHRHALRWNGCSLDLSGEKARAVAGKLLRERLKEMAYPRLSTELRSILKKLGSEAEQPIEQGSPFRMLDTASILEMADSGLIDFGGHTVNHVILSRLGYQEQLEEVCTSVNEIRPYSSSGAGVFAYPNGRATDFNADTKWVLANCGVQAAVTTMAGPNDPSTGLFELRRCGVGSGDDSVGFQGKVHHFSWILQSLLFR